MRIVSIASLIILSILCMKAHAQDVLLDTGHNANDSLNFMMDQEFRRLNDSINFSHDATALPAQDSVATKINVEPFKPNPNKAILYSAIFPGLGQIYNRKYWKLPIIYGGFLGLTYAISWNGRYYNDYSDAYKAIMSADYLTPGNINKWFPFIYTNLKPEDLTEGQLNNFRQAFKKKKDYYRRYRDLSIIGTVAVYGLCMLDAYVDAQLYDFDISPDLSFKVQPALLDNGMSRFGVLAIQCSVTF
ncbi:DUF5683 domain-containing protein [Dysgonomonas sp. 520]|uniref:DUF5683 domain-containing protein n=1 Tax=Dysgonomonas sp. 520 TaxID=2302931 RepID=UPI0013D5538B|nr:DUF5683 domain-containing protein [Dysgonomonas sp. 520]NDW10527.1 hypothetical protein [Dysgonomonas sp. 520]